MSDALQALQSWRDAGWLRPLDLALARFIHQLDAGAPPSLLLATALLAQLEGRGHSCLPLATLRAEGSALLGWPPEADASLADALASLPADAESARQAWAGRPVLQADPPDDTGNSPLVLQDDRLYLRRYWRDESRVAAQVLARAAADALPIASRPLAWQRHARDLMAQLFPAAASPGDAETTPDWQQVACALGLRGRLTLVTGGPGTGKTYTAARLLVLLQALHVGPQPLRVALAAPTGKAAARLRQSIAQALQALPGPLQAVVGHTAAALGPARTLHALLGVRPNSRRFVHDASHPLDLDLLFVDEASMVHLEMMAALLDALPASARLVLLGDRDQLASVEAGAVMADLCQADGAADSAGAPDAATADWVHALTGQVLPGPYAGIGHPLAQQTVTLRRSRRFAGTIGQLAQAVNQGDADAALALLRGAGNGPVHLLSPRDAALLPGLAINGRAGVADGYRGYALALAARPAPAEGADAWQAWATAVLRQFERCRVLCAVREGPWGVQGLNSAVERALAHDGLLARRGEWYEGRPVMVTRNDPALGVFNGDIGLVLRPPGVPAEAAPDTALRLYFADTLDGSGDGSGDGGLRSVAVGRLADVATAFAMTVHKSQGSEFEHVVLVLPEDDSPVLTRELLYTGITRARSALTVVAPEPRRLASACGRLTRRLSGLKARLRAPA